MDGCIRVLICLDSELVLRLYYCDVSSLAKVQFNVSVSLLLPFFLLWCVRSSEIMWAINYENMQVVTRDFNEW
jgi:hypothetical protein